MAESSARGSGKLSASVESFSLGSGELSASVETFALGSEELSANVESFSLGSGELSARVRLLLCSNYVFLYTLIIPKIVLLRNEGSP
jgi:hypothetical protein